MSEARVAAIDEQFRAFVNFKGVISFLQSRVHSKYSIMDVTRPSLVDAR